MRTDVLLSFLLNFDNFSLFSCLKQNVKTLYQLILIQKFIMYLFMNKLEVLYSSFFAKFLQSQT